MAVNDITDRILDRARRQVDEVVAAARAEADRLRAAAGERTVAAAAAAAETVAAEAAAAERRIVAAAEMEARQESLAAMQQAIDRALGAAVDTLAEADEKPYLAFLERLLRQNPFTGPVELVVSDNDADIVTRNLSRLQAAAPGAEITVAEDHPPLRGGFILRRGKVEFNASLDAIRRGREEDLRAAASVLLFGGGSDQAGPAAEAPEGEATA